MRSSMTPEATRLLSLAADHMLEHGVSGVSLSGMAKDIGSNNRMLLYYFGSKDALFSAALRTAYARFPELHAMTEDLLSRRGSLGERIGSAWRSVRAPQNLPYLHLFFETFVLAARDPEANRSQLDDIRTEWPRALTKLFDEHGYTAGDAARAVVQLLALWRGLQLMLLEGADPAGLDDAHDRAISALFDERRRPVG